MFHTRVIPCLLLRNGGLVKTVKFKDPTYIGDPINAVRIFNDKGADELVFLDISATPEGRGPNLEVLEEIASEAFMPFAYGGGITTAAQVRSLYALGIEKVVINTAAAATPTLVTEAAEIGGSSGVVASMDVNRDWLGRYGVYVNSGRKRVSSDPVAYARELERLGAGEILVNAIHRDGTMEGYDLPLIRSVSEAVSVPVVACGGAGSIDHFRQAVDHGASAAAAGSFFVFHGRHRAVLITYPDAIALDRSFR